MEINSAKNLQWSNADHTAFDCLITTDTLENVPFTATEKDVEPHGAELWADGVAGKYGVIAVYVAPVLTVTQKVAAALEAGVVVQSTATPALNATYSITPQAISNINAAVTYVMLNNQFPGKEATMPWADNTGAVHTFPDLPTFKAFASEVADYVAAISIYSDTNGSAGAIPQSNVLAIP